MYVVYAHRGASEYYPENTLSSFYAGVEMGANGIETDVWRTKDGVLVIWHDDKLEWKTELKGSVPDYTYDELLGLVIRNDKYAPRADKIPTFEEFLKHFGWRDLTFAIELKQYGIAKDVIDMIERFDMKDKVIITSFKYEELEEAYTYDKSVRIGWLYGGVTDGERIEKLKAIRAYQACPKAEDVTAEELKLIYQSGFDCRTWGIFNTDIMKKAFDDGINGGMTVNFPDKLLDYIKEKNLVLGEF